MNRRGFTLLEAIIAGTIMAVAVFFVGRLIINRAKDEITSQNRTAAHSAAQNLLLEIQHNFNLRVNAPTDPEIQKYQIRRVPLARHTAHAYPDVGELDCHNITTAQCYGLMMWQLKDTPVTPPTYRVIEYNTECSTAGGLSAAVYDQLPTFGFTPEGYTPTTGEHGGLLCAGHFPQIVKRVYDGVTAPAFIPNTTNLLDSPDFSLSGITPTTTYYPDKSALAAAACFKVIRACDVPNSIVEVHIAIASLYRKGTEGKTADSTYGIDRIEGQLGILGQRSSGISPTVK
jgi:Tfp pilus assembly protein PilV